MRPALRIASAAAHRELLREGRAARKAEQAAAAAALEIVDVEREIRRLDERISRYEELIARLPDELPWKAGRTRLKLGKEGFDLVLSTKPELRELVALMKSWRAELSGAEGGRRLAAAAALAERLLDGPAKRKPAQPAEREAPADAPAPVGRWG